MEFCAFSTNITRSTCQIHSSHWTITLSLDYQPEQWKRGHKNSVSTNVLEISSEFSLLKIWNSIWNLKCKLLLYFDRYFNFKLNKLKIYLQSTLVDFLCKIIISRQSTWKTQFSSSEKKSLLKDFMVATSQGIKFSFSLRSKMLSNDALDASINRINWFKLYYLSHRWSHIFSRIIELVNSSCVP